MTVDINTARRRARFEFWSYRGQFPSVYLPVARMRHRRAIAALAERRNAPIDPDSSPPPVGPFTDVVIEGFPRSGNTFAVGAFRMAQIVKPLIAHHHHVPAQVIAGAKKGIPVLLLIREPDEAVLSYVVRYPHLALSQALRHYIRFYSRCLPYRSDVVTASFDEVTSDMGAVTRRLNERFRTAFAEFEHTEANVARCFDEMQDHERDVLGPIDRFGSMTSRPTAKRDELKESLREKLDTPKHAGQRARAQDLFGTFTSRS
jgi:hypothetical protein